MIKDLSAEVGALSVSSDSQSISVFQLQEFQTSEMELAPYVDVNKETQIRTFEVESSVPLETIGQASEKIKTDDEAQMKVSLVPVRKHTLIECRHRRAEMRDDMNARISHQTLPFKHNSEALSMRQKLIFSSEIANKSFEMPFNSANDNGYIDKCYQLPSAQLSDRRVSPMKTVHQLGGCPTEHLQYKMPEPVAAQETIKSHIKELIHQYASTIAAWKVRVAVAECYRDKHVRTGGRPTTVRPQDRGFLEHAAKTIISHLHNLRVAKSMLFVADSSSDNELFLKKNTLPPDAAREDLAWRSYCERMRGKLDDLILEADGMRRRVDNLCTVPSDHGMPSPKKAHPCSPQTPRSSRSCRDGPRQSTSYSLADLPRRSASVGSQSIAHSSTPPSTLCARLVQRGNQNVISPWSSSTPQLVTCTFDVPPSTDANGAASTCDAALTSSSPLPNATVTQADPNVSPHRLATKRDCSSSLASVNVSKGEVRSLRPDTIRTATEAGSRYDRTSPYGQLAPSHYGLALGLQKTPMLLSTACSLSRTQEVLVRYPCSKRSTPQQSLPGSLRHSQSCPTTHEVGGTSLDGCGLEETPETYIHTSLPGNLEPHALPQDSREQRWQALLTIENYEKNARSLCKAHLKHARECFMEFYGPQCGLRQYCSWVEELTMRAVREGYA